MLTNSANQSFDKYFGIAHTDVDYHVTYNKI